MKYVWNNVKYIVKIPYYKLGFLLKKIKNHISLFDYERNKGTD